MQLKNLYSCLQVLSIKSMFLRIQEKSHKKREKVKIFGSYCSLQGCGRADRWAAPSGWGRAAAAWDRPWRDIVLPPSRTTGPVSRTAARSAGGWKWWLCGRHVPATSAGTCIALMTSCLDLWNINYSWELGTIHCEALIQNKWYFSCKSKFFQCIGSKR